MQCPAAELELRQSDDLIAEVEIFNSADRDRLVVTEMERISRRARIDVNLGDVIERTICEGDGVVAAATNDRIVPGVARDVEAVVAVAALERRVRARGAT